MTEIQRTYEETQIVDDSIPSFEELVSEFTEGSRYEIAGQLRQARAAASVVKYYGKASMKAFASEVGKSPAWVYDLARVWLVYGHIFEGTDGLAEKYSNRLETLGISHFVKALRAPDPIAHVERAHDEGWTTRETEEKAKEAEHKEAAGSRNAEVITHMVCPACGVISPMSQVETREVEV